MLKRPTILIVEDEPAIADTIQYALETEGFATRYSGTGREVLPLLDTASIDLVILDIGLPDINGIDLCKQIRTRFSVPVVFLTARSDEVDRVVGLEIGGDDYVVKPFSPRELAARVKAVLRRARPGAGIQISESAFEIDRHRRRISYFGVGLELSRYEYNVLCIFIEHPGQVFSREQLMSRAWDEPEAAMDRTVDAHIKNIRAKLKQVNPEHEAIITHRGVGYSMKERA